MTYIMIQACRRRFGVVSTLTRIDRYDQDCESKTNRLVKRSIAKWQRRLPGWHVIGCEVDQEEASEVLADLGVTND